jgi:hypothetical protein
MLYFKLNISGADALSKSGLRLGSIFFKNLDRPKPYTDYCPETITTDATMTQKIKKKVMKPVHKIKKIETKLPLPGIIIKLGCCF